MYSGDIIIATNLAGRGSDIKTNESVEQNGSLHVSITFLPSNKRVEDQGFGRTSRQGNKGTGQLIINDIYERIKLNKYDSLVPVETIESFKNWRDIREKQRLQETREKRLTRIEADDQLFNSFNQLFQGLKAKENNEYKLAQQV